jgi:PAS domain S-box-containing protein
MTTRDQSPTVRADPVRGAFDGRDEATVMSREIVSASPHAIALLGTDGLVLEVNPATERLLGRGRREILGKPCEPFTHPDDHELELPLLDAVLRGASDGYTIEKRYLRSGGQPVWARLHLRLIRDDRGEPLRLLALIEDISEQRRLDEEQKRLTPELIEHRDSLQRALTAAEQADEQVRTILECITDGFVAIDRDWHYSYVNKRAGELFGRDPDELLGKHIWEEFPEGVGQPFYEAYQKAMADRTTIFLEAYYEPWDRWFENRIYGSRTGIAVYFTDVSDRKRIEEVERRRRERTDALREANDALTRSLRLEEVLGVLLDSVALFVPYTSAGVLLRDDQSRLTIGASRGHEQRDGAVSRSLPGLHRHPVLRRVLEDGRTVVVADTEREHRGDPLLAPGRVRSWLGVPLRAGGQVIGLCALESSQPAAFQADDVEWAEALTLQAAAAIENARLHDQLQRRATELEQRVAELAESQRVAHIGSFVWDIAEDRITWSDELYRIYGLEPDAFTATFETFVERLHPDDRERVVATIQRTLAQGEPWSMQERIVRPTGEVRHLSTWGEVERDEEGRPTRLLGICDDVTELVLQRKQLERHAAELEQRVAERTKELRLAMEEAERANSAKSEFLAGISHELRTPMNAILGFAQLLELDELEGEQADNVRQILGAGRHLLELITELLDIARIESGEVALSLEAVSLEGLLVEATDLTRPLAEELGVTVAIEGEPGGYVFADRQRALQVLLNLLANGVKYNRRGGTVTVACTSAGSGPVAIAVSDTGDGIAPEDLDRLFVPFERLGLEAGAIEGAGLGLTLAQRLVDAMGGTLSVASAVGVGSTFTVELPRADDPLAALEATTAQRPAQTGRTATILYIEDNLANLQLVKRALARQPGLTVLEATRGEVGLEVARTSRPDLVLLDLHLPDMPGEDVLEALSSGPDTAEIPVVVVSAAASKGRVRRLRQRGASEYLTKPIDIAELVSVVNATLAR